MSGKQRSGDIFGIVKYYLKCNRSQAKKWVHKKYNVELPYSASTMAKDILSSYYIAYLSKAYFECQNNVWEEIEDEYVKNLIIKEIEGQGISHNQPRISEVLKYLNTYAYNKHGLKLGESIKSDIKKRDQIAFTNCVVNVDTWATRECQPDDYIMTRIPFKYENKSFHCPLWLKFLDSVFEGKKEKQEIIDFLQEWMGYSLVPDTTLEKALIFVGEGANGKSVFLYIWGGIVGGNNCSHIDLGDINNEQYTAQLLGKTLNVATDIRSENQFDTGILKKLVSGEKITGKSVYQKPIEFTNYARLVFATNTLPYLKEGGTSVQRRLYILHFENVFKDGNKDTNLKFKLETELKDILLWAIEGLKRLRKRGAFQPPRSVEMAVDDYLHESDTVALFLEDSYEITKDSDHNNIERNILYQDYQKYCKDNGYKYCSNRKVYERLRMMGVSERKSSGKRCLVGIRAIDAEPEQKEIDFSHVDNGEVQI
jgi:P4 family phage/plasmid primase-like protien